MDQTVLVVISIARPAERSEAARTKETEEGLPVHSVTTLVCDLATIVMNHVASSIERVGFGRQASPPSSRRGRSSLSASSCRRHKTGDSMRSP